MRVLIIVYEPSNDEQKVGPFLCQSYSESIKSSSGSAPSHKLSHKMVFQSTLRSYFRLICTISRTGRPYVRCSRVLISALPNSYHTPARHQPYNNQAPA
jgi:hypothetical protein